MTRKELGPAATTSAETVTLGRVAPGAWAALTLGTSVTAASGFRTPQCRLEGVDVVRLQGRLSVSANLSAAAVVFTLPAGYRPAVAVSLTSSQTNGVVVLNVATNGQVSIQTAVSSGGALMLDHLAFAL